MKKIKPREMHTERLDIKIPTYEEQYYLWDILRQENVNIYYQSTPSRFKTRREYQEALQDWDKQKKFFYEKIDNLDKDEHMYTWTLYLKGSDKLVGQMTVQPNEKYDDLNIRNAGWFIDPKYQGQGLAYEAALEIFKFMFNEVEIEKIETESVIENPSSWKSMEKLGFVKTGTIKAGYKDMDENDIYKYTLYCTKDMFLENVRETEKEKKLK